MTLEVIDISGVEVSNPQGVETEVGNPFPEVIRETTNEGQILWLKSSPTSSLGSQSPKDEDRLTDTDVLRWLDVI